MKQYKLIIEESDGIKFKPTVQWMSENYAKANKELFGGQLGECVFKVEPIKSNTKWLGSFGISSGIYGKKLYAKRSSRRLFLEDSFGRDEYVTANSFFEMCRPTITLSTYYSGTQESLYATLVHEMCHYYTYMNGYAPRQAHGPEFRNIGSVVAYRSNGTLTVQRIASAEQMSGYDVDDELKQKMEKRKNNKITNMCYLVVKLKDGNTRLVSTTSQATIDKVFYVENSRGSNIYVILDDNIKNELFDKGYNVSMRKYSYYPVVPGKDSFELINKAFNEGKCKKIN